MRGMGSPWWLGQEVQLPWVGQLCQPVGRMRKKCQTRGAITGQISHPESELDRGFGTSWGNQSNKSMEDALAFITWSLGICIYLWCCGLSMSAMESVLSETLDGGKCSLRFTKRGLNLGKAWVLRLC